MAIGDVHLILVRCLPVFAGWISKGEGLSNSGQYWTGEQAGCRGGDTLQAFADCLKPVLTYVYSRITYGYLR